MLTVIKDAGRDERKAFADHIRGLADEFEAGDLTNILVVGNNVRENVYFNSADFADRWRMIEAD